MAGMGIFLTIAEVWSPIGESPNAWVKRVLTIRTRDGLRRIPLTTHKQILDILTRDAHLSL